MGTVTYSRPYYWGENCHHGWFVTDDDFGIVRKQTPAVQQVVTMVGGLAPFKKGSERVLRTMTGLRLSESTIQRTTEDIGQEIDQLQSQGDAVAPPDEWKWHRDAEDRSCAYLSLDATGVRQQGPHGEKAEGRMAWVMEVFNPLPQPSETTQPPLEPAAAPASALKELPNSGGNRLQARARYGAGLMDLPEAGRRLRRLAESVKFQAADVVIGLTDGGNGLADCLETHCLSGLTCKTVLILDFYHVSEHLETFGKEWIREDTARTQQVERWCHMAKHEGGQALLTDLESLDLRGCSETVKESHRCLTQYIGNNLYRMDYPRYEKAGWQIGSGNIESACKTVINQRLNSGGMRWRERGTNTVCHIRALFCSEHTVWDDFWRKRPKHRAA